MTEQQLYENPRLYFDFTKTYSLPNAHSSFIQAVAISPDNSQVISGSGDWNIKFWDIETRKIQHTIKHAHQDWIYVITFTPDGVNFITASADCSIKVWNYESRTLVHTFEKAHKCTIFAIVITPNSETMISTGADWCMKFWDLTSKQQFHTIHEAHSSYIMSLAITPDGLLSASGDGEGSVKLWDVAQKYELSFFRKMHRKEINAIIFSPGMNYIITGSADCAIKIKNIYENADLIELKEAHSGAITALAMSADDRYFISASTDGTIKIWDWETKDLMHRFKEELKNEIFCLVISPDGSKVASGTSNFSLNLYEIKERVLPDETRVRFLDRVCELIELVIPELKELHGLEGKIFQSYLEETRRLDERIELHGRIKWKEEEIIRKLQSVIVSEKVLPGYESQRQKMIETVRQNAKQELGTDDLELLEGMMKESHEAYLALLAEEQKQLEPLIRSSDADKTSLGRYHIAQKIQQLKDDFKTKLDALWNRYRIIAKFFMLKLRLDKLKIVIEEYVELRNQFLVQTAGDLEKYSRIFIEILELREENEKIHALMLDKRIREKGLERLERGKVEVLKESSSFESKDEKIKLIRQSLEQESKKLEELSKKLEIESTTNKAERFNECILRFIKSKRRELEVRDLWQLIQEAKEDRESDWDQLRFKLSALEEHVFSVKPKLEAARSKQRR